MTTNNFFVSLRHFQQQKLTTKNVFAKKIIHPWLKMIYAHN
jgi:hypothetical protein